MNATLYPAAATITAALIAALVAYLSSVLSKEQKTSEFRYSWLNAVLDDTAKFISGVESLTAVASSLLKNEGKAKAEAFLAGSEAQLSETLAAYYRARIRLYPQEHARAVQAIDNLCALILRQGIPDRMNVEALVREVVQASHEALKDEWRKVKKGETTFQWTKYVSLAVLGLVFAGGAGFAIYAALR